MSTPARRKLAAPTVAMLPRVADSLSFLYLDVVRVYQDDTGICAHVATEKRGSEYVYLPTAALSSLLLGPGTSITARALTTLARHGTTVVATGAGGVRCYSAMVAHSLSTDWLEHQARAWADPHQRLAVARRMYAQRFGDAAVAPEASLAQMRGMEGQRIKAMYRLLAQQYKLGRFRRSYDPEDWDDQDPVNLALSSANTCLYGIVHAAVVALGCSPALGFIHSGNQQAFVYDIADLYKAELTIPLAFSLNRATHPEQQARRHFRDQLRLFQLLPRIVTDIQRLLAPDVAIATPDLEEQVVDLWDPVSGVVPGAVNHAGEAE
ncbi:type I-E CRISPR-associated endonuclease Cas1e [Streptomonospora wellingtoniae]|uniref:CRISPR-associated endonuclease Cas1 n=1 Tax=Streptomonospora wellingtoniae TaxID=3075544 RepID=A0ABU2KNN8_9ACTN|nr:type I-E CRISPR-associated endonuclease Cas1e [Streptomonospora sp. DSM 45055]MDT0300836.1 type I-E CRISPR-associated endonuclease Cas1e [Streptomonospora sp. DSM 45055]